MYRWFEPVIRPLMERAGASTVVEVGADLGYLTEKLLSWATDADGTVHTIDPRPRFDVDAWKSEHGDRFVPHVGLSLSEIPTLPAVDVVLIDGDHNWFTVINELRLIDEHIAMERGAWPIVVLHDVGWPYGRRDLYYDPQTVPEWARKPYRRAGLHPDAAEPDDRHAFNAHLYNAVDENTEQNGVLTAVEDFLTEAERNLELTVVDGVNGLGIVWEPSSSTDALMAFVRSLEAEEPIRSVIRMIERDRLLRLTEFAEVAARHKKVTAALEDRQAQWRETEEELQRQAQAATEALASAQQEAAAANRARTEAQAEAGRLEARLEAAMKATDAARQVARSKERELAEATTRLQRRTREIEQLKDRRLVRIALTIASFAAPLIRAVRRLKRSRRDPARQAPSTTPPAAAPARLGPPVDTQADIVVCVHNAPMDVERCLESIVEHTNLQRHQLIIVDDGSGPETAGLLESFVQDHPETILVRNPEARGYTRAANQGIAAGSAPFFVLLNSDTITTADWLESLIRCAAIMPEAAIVGPLSNAASWQSIPETTGDDGAWVVNELPPGVSPNDVAEEISRRGTQLYPQLTLINGFCYLVRRDVVDEIGALDEDTFPTGYGEEDDFSLRAQDAGYRAYLADDAYVFHAKSKSFTPEGRRKHVEANTGRLFEKHSEERVRQAVDSVRRNEGLVRARTVASLVASETGHGHPEPPELRGLRVAWAQPHLRQVGGIRRAIEMTNLLTSWGADVTLVTPDGEPTDWLPIKGRVASHLKAMADTFDVLMVSDPDVMEWSVDLRAPELLVFHLAAYLLYRRKNDALASYYDLRGTHIANSTWTAETIADHIDGEIAAVVPGAVDRRLFRPVRAVVTHDVVCYGSTRKHKGTATIEAAAAGRMLLRMDDHDLPQGRLSEAICSGRVFASGSWHEGFNLPPLEAMACGVPVAMTDDGGSRDYAVDGENALVVPVHDSDMLRKAIDRLLDEPMLRVSLIESGLRTAWSYTWHNSTAKLAEVLQEL